MWVSSAGTANGTPPTSSRSTTAGTAPRRAGHAPRPRRCRVRPPVTRTTRPVSEGSIAVPPKRTNHRVTEGTEENTEKTTRYQDNRLQMPCSSYLVLSSWAFLCALCDSVVRPSSFLNTSGRAGRSRPTKSTFPCVPVARCRRRTTSGRWSPARRDQPHAAELTRVLHAQLQARADRHHPRHGVGAAQVPPSPARRRPGPVVLNCRVTEVCSRCRPTSSEPRPRPYSDRPLSPTRPRRLPRRRCTVVAGGVAGASATAGCHCTA